MTALSDFDRLECEGQYASGDGSTAQPVVVQFGNASLTILTFDDMPLAHWPLASLDRREAAHGTLVVAPDIAATETLSIQDATMRAALDRLSTSAPPAPRRRRPRLVIGLLVVSVISAALFWLMPDPYALLARRLPPEAEAALGQAAIRAYAGPLCTHQAGQRALRQLARGIASDRHPQPTIFVADQAEIGVIAASGDTVLVSNGALLAAVNARALAALMQRALTDAALAEPTLEALRAAGPAAIPALLRGQVTAPRLIAAAAAELRGRRPVDGPISAEHGAALLTPSAWTALRGICEG